MRSARALSRGHVAGFTRVVGHVARRDLTFAARRRVTNAAASAAHTAIVGELTVAGLASHAQPRRTPVAGMLAGAALFVRAYPRMKPLLEAGDYGKSTLPLATRTSPWPWIGAMATAVAAGALASDAPPKARQLVDRWLRRGRGLVRS